MRSIYRITGCSINTISKLLVGAGEACAKFHDETVRGVACSRVQCDELWSFCYAKAKKAPYIQGSPDYAGSVWTWTALDVDSRLIVNWHVSIGRDKESAIDFMHDLRQQLSRRVSIVTDGLDSYIEAVEREFGSEADYAQLVKQYEGSRYVEAERAVIAGFPDVADISTSYRERLNLTTRMAVRRYTRGTNGYSKKLRNHCYALALFYVWYNFCRTHLSLSKPYPTTSAMAAGLADGMRDMNWLIELVDATVPKLGPRGPYKMKSVGSVN